MKGSIEQELEILETILSFRNDPVGFVYYAYPWGEHGTPFADLPRPRKWQLEELELLAEHVRQQEFALANNLPLKIWQAGYSSGRGPGKSALFGMLAHWHTSTHLGAATLVAANTESQLRSTTFPEFSKWFNASINAHWFCVEGMNISIEHWLQQIVCKPVSEGGRGIDAKYWTVSGKTWTEENPSAFVGPHNAYGLLVLFDEASGIHSSIWERTEGFFTEVNAYRFWLAASQMRNRQGRLYEIFYDQKLGAGWRTRTMSTRGMEGIDQTLVENQIAKYGPDSDFVRVEIDGLPPRTSEDQFIPWENVRQAQANDLFRDYGEPLIGGVDPAPRGRTVIRFRQGRNARDCVGPSTAIEMHGADNMHIAEKIIDLDTRFKPDAWCIDFGMGTGVIDILKRKRLYGRIYEVKFGGSPGDKTGEYATRGTELWAKVRDWLPNGMIAKDDGERGTLSDQLTNRGWRWSGREDNKKILETKEDLRSRGVASPDDADALACTFEVNPPRRAANQRDNVGGPYICDGVEPSMLD